jgi:hypothetical protein
VLVIVGFTAMSCSDSGEPAAAPEATSSPTTTLQVVVPPTAEPRPAVPAATEPTANVPRTTVPTTAPNNSQAPTSVPLATESADSVVIKGDGWEVTTGEVAEIVDRVEEILGDELLEPAVAFQADDIGAGRARGFEFIEEDTWLVLQRLGTVPLGADRRVANQTRLDRIQGLCCEATGGNDVVVVEAAESEPMTKAVIAHQLTEDEQADVLPYLGIFSPEQRAEIGEGAADFMEFGYQWGPRFMEAVEAEGGRDAVLAVMLEVPTSSAQVLFPDKFFAGEEPPVEGGSTFRLEGTLGAATGSP